VLESIWSSLSVLDSDFVDYLISQCDAECLLGDSHQRRTWTTPTHNQFTVFQSRHTSGLLSNAKNLLIGDSFSSTPQSPVDRMLFHHYTPHVAFLMIPLEHPRNPWSSHYPAVARMHLLPEQKALYNAMLAHAAYNLALLGSSPTKMMVAAATHYSKAIEQLNACIESTDRDYCGTVAAIITLMMAEVNSFLQS
jgi:hypothetical protein